MTNGEMLLGLNKAGPQTQALVNRYVLAPVACKEGRSYSEEGLVRESVKVWRRWLDYVKKSVIARASFHLSFYHWLSREADLAMVVKPGDIVKTPDHGFCSVTGYGKPGFTSVTWYDERENGAIRTGYLPKPVVIVDVRDAEGHGHSIYAPHLQPAEVPQEILDLLCAKAKNCPMLNGGE